MKLSEWRLQLKDGVSAGLSKIAAISDKASMKVSNLQDKLNVKSKNLGKDLKALGSNVKSQVSSTLSSVAGMGNGMGAALTNPYVLIAAATIGVAAKATSMAMTFEEGMAKINATAQLPRAELNKLGEKIRAIGTDSAQDLMAMPDAFEKILSQTNDVTASLDILKVATKGADAGFADINTIGDTLARSMSLLSKEGLTAEQVMDKLFKSKKLGSGEMKDFAQYMPSLTAAGQALGVSFDNTAGTFAYMTGMGQSAADSAMLMQNLYTQLGKGDVQKNMAKIGVDIFNKDGSMKAMDEIFGTLSAKMDGLSDQSKSNLLEKLGIHDTQAKSAFSVMINDAAKLKTTIDGVKNSAGETNKQLGYTANPMRTVDEIGNQIKSFMLEIGYVILPYVSQAFYWIKDVVGGIVAWVKDWWNKSTLIQDIFWLIGKVLGFVWTLVGKIGDMFLWVYEHTIKPIWDAVNWIYDKIKDILGFGKEEVKIKASVDTQGKVEMPTTPEQMGVKPLTNKQVAAMGAGGKGGNDNATNKGISSVSGGGAQTRNVLITMNNNISLKATTIKENLKEMESKMLETLVRVAQGAELTLANN